MATYKGHNEDSSGNILLSIGNGMTATVETGPTASQAYTKGAYLFFNNRFCKATAAISSGATLAIGTNLSETSVGAEITSHLRSSDGKEFYFDVKDGTYGYYPSASKTASEFVPFGGTSSKIELPSVSISSDSGTFTYDCSSISGYQSKTLNDFTIAILQVTAGRGIYMYNNGLRTALSSYNPSTGVLTWQLLWDSSGTSSGANLTVKPLLIY